MGNTQSQHFQTRFHAKYAFNQLFDDHNFGHIKIYRKKQLNYDYVMVLQKYVHLTVLNPLIQQIKLVHKAFLQPDQPMALRIFNYQTIQDRWSECKMPMIRIYVEYFNFTLKDLIQKKLQKCLIFTYEEIMYIIFLQVYIVISVDLNISMVTVNSRCIYLSPEGCVKLIPVKIQDFYQKNDAFCNAICYETKQKVIVKFQRRDRQLLSQIKKLFTEILKLYYKTQQNDITKILIRDIIKAHNIGQIQKIIVKPELQYLTLIKKQGGDTTESLASLHSQQLMYEKTVSLDENSNGKLSVKNRMNDLDN